MTAARTTPPLRVAIIGASLAGLFAAAATSRAGHLAAVLERDALSDAACRPGVSQYEQPHVFLKRGLRATEELLPGLRDELLAAGAVPFDTGRLAWLGEEGWAPIRESGFEVVSLSRPLFERVVRRRVRALPGVELRSGMRVSGLRRTPSAAPGWRVCTSDNGVVDADLVVDASGRNSRLPVWLAELGVPAPAVEEVDARMGYATRAYRDGPDLGRLSGIVQTCTPASPVGGLVLPVENGGWLVLASGMGEHRPPRDVAGFERFLRELPDPAVADFVRRAVPAGPVIVHRHTANRRRRYERLRDWPAGLLAIGDALACFNPVFGQGITVAAAEAIVMQSALARGSAMRDSRAVMGKFAAITALPWSIAVGQDVRQPTCAARESHTQAVTNTWARELARLGVHGNTRATGALTRMYHLMGTPTSLLHPALLAAAVRARLTGSGPAAGRPEDLAALAATPAV